jgi:molecular chaperone GrpE
MTDKEMLEAEQQPEAENAEIQPEAEIETPDIEESETAAEAAGEAEAKLADEVTEAEEAAAEAEEVAEEAEETVAEISPEMAALVEEIKELRKAADDARDHALRAQAELQNFRRRKEREVADRIALANEGLILELLPVLDDFERAFEAIPEEDREQHAAWIQGFDLIYRKLQKILENQGLTAIEATGEFDPNVHEAVTMVPSDEVASGEIVQELRKGYKLKDKVVRASLVSVAQ